MKISSVKTYNPDFEAYKLGVTGNIASGKSTVQKYFEAEGIKCVDVDEICHKLYDSDKTVIEQVKAMFGRFGFHELDKDNFIDRKKIRTLVFKNPEIKKELENIVHPAVERSIADFVNENEKEKFVAIFNPLLYETKNEKSYDKVLFIKIGPQLQLKRLLNRNSFLTEETAKERINSQMGQDKKSKKSDFVIDNSFGSEKTIAQVNSLLKKLSVDSAWNVNKINKFKSDLKNYIVGYPKRINYTWKHKKAFLKVEKELCGKNSLSGYLHDADKLFMYLIGIPKELAHNIHVATAPHHIQNGKIKKPVMAVIDWECARYTKPDKPLSAREFYELCCPQMPEIEEAFKILGL